MSYGEPLEDKGKGKWDFTEFKGRGSVDLLARMIYSEARGESKTGKRACAFVAKNRKANGGFGGKTYESVLLASGQFEGMTTESARKPKISSQAWKDGLAIASDLASQTNPIGNRLYFLAYKPTSSKAKDILQIGNQYFFNRS